MENFIFKTLGLPLECFCMTLLLETNLPHDDRVLMVPKESCCIRICKELMVSISTVSIYFGSQSDIRVKSYGR